MLDIKELRLRLPKVGDHLIRTPITCGMGKSIPHECVVTYVHPDNLWYQVEFTYGKNKFKQNYNLLDPVNKNGSDVCLTKNKTDYLRSYIRKVKISDDSVKSISDIIKEMEEYNKRNKTCIKYGEYVSKISKGEFK